MTVRFSLDMDDWLAFNEYYFRTSPEMKKTRRNAIIVFPVAMALTALAMSLDSPMPWAFYALLAVASLAWVLFYPRRFEKNALKKARKLLAEGDNSGLLCEQEFQFGEDGLRVATNNSTETMAWDRIKKLVATDGYYYLYNSAVSAYILPRAKLGLGPEEAAHLDGLLTSRLADVRA